MVLSTKQTLHERTIEPTTAHRHRHRYRLYCTYIQLRDAFFLSLDALPQWSMLRFENAVCVCVCVLMCVVSCKLGGYSYSLQDAGVRVTTGLP